MESEGIIKGRKKRKLSSPTLTFESFVHDGQEELTRLLNESKKLRISTKESTETAPKIFIKQTDKMRLKVLEEDQQRTVAPLTEKSSNIKSKTIEKLHPLAAMDIKDNESSSIEHNSDTKINKEIDGLDKSTLKNEKDSIEKEERKARKRAKKRAEKERRRAEKKALKAALKEKKKKEKKKKKKKESKNRPQEERRTMR